MWIQIMNAAEWLLFILLIFNGIQIYRKLKHKEKIPRKTALIFIFIFVLYVMVTRANYCRTHPGAGEIQTGITYYNVRMFVYIIVFCLGLTVMKRKMKKIALKWIAVWAIICIAFGFAIQFWEVENAYLSFATAEQAAKYYGIDKNKIDEIYGEDSIDISYLQNGESNSKIIYKTENGWKCATYSEVKYIYTRADFERDTSIAVKECTVTGEFYITASYGTNNGKDFRITDTENTTFVKKEWVDKKGEQISYEGYLGKEKPENYKIYLNDEEISVDWSENDIMITS